MNWRLLKRRMRNESDATIVGNIVLAGPHERVRQSLFASLIEGRGRTARIGASYKANIGHCTLNGDGMDVINLPEEVDHQTESSLFDRARFAICVDPFEDLSQERIEPFLHRIRSGVWSPACLALVSETDHLSDYVDQRWSEYLARHRAAVKIHRVNCAVPCSTRLFAKLLMSVVGDCGDASGGITVSHVTADTARQPAH